MGGSVVNAALNALGNGLRACGDSLRSLSAAPYAPREGLRGDRLRAFGEWLRAAMAALRAVDLAEIDWEDCGEWPPPLKALALAAAWLAALAAGYFLLAAEPRREWRQAAAAEHALREEFSRKARLAGSIDAYRAQTAAMEAAAAELLRQLPAAAEAPGLLEDISAAGGANGLEFESIALGGETPRAFYAELPIDIAARGSYHDLGAFVSGMAAFPRIVTLHDFRIRRDDAPNGALRLELAARAYRYAETGASDDDE